MQSVDMFTYVCAFTHTEMREREGHNLPRTFPREANRRDFRKINNLDDIEGARPSNKRATFVHETGRITNPLCPSYVDLDGPAQLCISSSAVPFLRRWRGSRLPSSPRCIHTLQARISSFGVGIVGGNPAAVPPQQQQAFCAQCVSTLLLSPGWACTVCRMMATTIPSFLPHSLPRCSSKSSVDERVPRSSASVVGSSSSQLVSIPTSAAARPPSSAGSVHSVASSMGSRMSALSSARPEASSKYSTTSYVPSSSCVVSLS